MLCLLASSIALSESNAAWHAWGERLTLTLDEGLLRDLGLSIEAERDLASTDVARIVLAAAPGAGLRFFAEGRDFRGLAGGELRFPGSVSLSFRDQRLVFTSLRLRPGERPLTFELISPDGDVLLLADHMHHRFQRDHGRLDFSYMDLNLSPWLAERIGYPGHAGNSVGMLGLSTAFDTPVTIEKGRFGNCRNPDWSPGLDVATTQITQVQQVGAVTGGRVVITPAAHLINAGLAEVPWIEAFKGPAGPYNNDQHPFLVWALYTIDNGVIRQLAYSDVKHAFNAVNIDCDCQEGNVLWSASHPDNNAPCKDVYGVRTNRLNEFLGPRDELVAHLGSWDHCGSHFDGEPVDCLRDNDGAEESEFEHGLSVAETALENEHADYLFEAWYLVRDDVNPDNNLAHVSIDPRRAGETWLFQPGATHSGPAIDAWVAPETASADAYSTTLDTGVGRLRLAVRVESLPAGRYRYRYALMNFTLDRQVREFAVPLPPGIALSEPVFFDADGQATNDWQVTVAPDAVRWRVSETAPDNTLDWGLLYSFGFEANVEPKSTGARLLALEGVDQPVYLIETLGPVEDVLFADGF